MRNQINILNEVIRERMRQDEKWGIQRHAAVDWLAILGEEYGEACKAAIESKFKHGSSSWEGYREELIQIAAVAISAIESYDRGDSTT
jgi:hypothetical protein